jgi:hypothetical protein
VCVQEREHKRARATARRLGRTPPSPTVLNALPSPADTHAYSAPTTYTHTPSSAPQDGKLCLSPIEPIAGPASPDSFYEADKCFDRTSKVCFWASTCFLVSNHIQTEQRIQEVKAKRGKNIRDVHVQEMQWLDNCAEENRKKGTTTVAFTRTQTHMHSVLAVKDAEMTTPGPCVAKCIDECLPLLSKKGVRRARADYGAACEAARQSARTAKPFAMPVACHKLASRWVRVSGVRVRVRVRVRKLINGFGFRIREFVALVTRYFQGYEQGQTERGETNKGTGVYSIG